MKNKFFLFLGLLILSSIFFFSCEDDLSQEKVTAQQTKTFNNLTSRKISGNALFPIFDKLNKSLNLDPKNKSLITTFSSDYNIDNVDLSEAIMVENELNQISYSFKIDQNQIESPIIENLVLIDRNGQYELAKFSYTMSDNFAQDYYNNTKTLIDFEGTLQIVTLTGDCCTINQAPITIGGNAGGGDSSGSNVGGSYYGGGGGATGGWGLGYAGGNGSSGGGNSAGGNSSSQCSCTHELDGCVCTCYSGTVVISNRMSHPASGDQTNTTPDRELCCIYNVGLFYDLDNFNALFIQNLNPQQLNWWNNADPNTKNDILNFIYPYNISDQSLQFVKELIDYTIENNNSQNNSFIEWAINYITNNPTVSIEQFKNWFMGQNEGRDFEYDEQYWENPNLTFPQQNLPTYNAFFNSYPKNQDGSWMVGADNVYIYVGGQVQQARINYPNDTNNTCALKVSIALNGAGISIPYIPGQTLQGGGQFSNQYFFLNARALNIWMRKTFGTTSNPNYMTIPASQIDVNGENLPTLLANVKGIYSLVCPLGSTWASGHADIIDNTLCAANCHFYDAPIEYIDVWKLN